MIKELISKLARDSKNNHRIDGTNHIGPHLKVQLLATLVFLGYLLFWVKADNPYYIVNSLIEFNLWFLLGALFFWVGSEWNQERLMVKDGKHPKNNHWKFWKWSLNRYQDIAFPEGSGVLAVLPLYGLRYFL